MLASSWKQRRKRRNPMKPGQQVRISIRGTLSDRLAAAFEGMAPVRRQGHTELIGEVVDQARLHGLLARIRDLGLELERVSVVTEETETRPDPDPGRQERA
jgi:hypothetical protein